jgi:2-polyprenyl-3-methyl-5-hydroxy-6-metoxy-1,4-benzoquinol methylase
MTQHQRGGNHFLAKYVDVELNYGRNIIKSFLEQISPLDILVDLGAGGGEDLSIAREISPGADLVGIDCDLDHAIDIQDKNYRVINLNIERDKLPFASESVDVFVANQVMEHIKEIFWIFHEVTRCLKINGHMIIGVPNLASLHNRYLLLLGKQPTQLKNYSAHVRGYTKSDMINFLEEAFPGGYALEGFAGSQFYPFPRFVAEKLSTWFPSMAYSLFFLVRKRKNYGDSFIRYPIEKGLETPFYVGKP